MTQGVLFESHDRHPMIDVCTYDRWGRLVAVIPASLGDRIDAHRLGLDSFDTAIKWGHIAIAKAEQRPPEPVTMFPDAGDPEWDLWPHVRWPCGHETVTCDPDARVGDDDPQIDQDEGP